MMQHFSAEQTRDRLPYDRLIEALREMFTKEVHAPLRHHHTLERESEPEATMLLMPAWEDGGLGGLKFVNVVPGNTSRDLPALSSSYQLFDNQTGQHLAMMDGGEITNRRTAAAAALGVDYLARKNAKRLLIVGSGRVAQCVAPAICSIRDIEEIEIWSIDPVSAEAMAAQLRADGKSVEVVSDLEAAVKRADIISCATLATDPIIKGEWLQPGQHLDLIGSFTPKMREADDEAVRRSRVYIDVDGALKETGDIIDPIRSGALTEDGICGDLAKLCKEEAKGRQSDEEITLFKAVGTALEDLAAAKLVYGH
jgi:ornithine cyclodeaminase